MTYKIEDYFEEKLGRPSDEWEAFTRKLTKKIFPKKTIVLAAGNIENHLTFIEQGSVRFYVQDDQGKENTFSFVFAGDFFSAYDSFLTRSPSTYFIETLNDAVVWQISYIDLQDVYQATAIGNTIGRLAAEDLFCKKIKRELSLLNETAEQRYFQLFEQRPEIIRYIPLKHIASYIGITPQALSRIRKRIS